MTGFRQRLSRIKRLIERFSDEGDIYGFAGVTKAMLLDAVGAAYDISQNITEEGSGRFLFEVISLKRKSSEFYKRYKDILDSDEATPDKERFDSFLSELSELIEKTRVVYSLQQNDGLVAAEDLGRARGEATEFKKLHDMYSGELLSAQGHVKKMEEACAEAARISKNLSQLEEEGTSAHETLVDKAGEVEGIAGNVAKWQQSISDCNSVITDTTTKIAESKSLIKQNEEAIAAIRNRADSVQGQIDEQVKKNAAIAEEAEKTLEKSNQVGMAASFVDRKRQLTVTQVIWSVIFFLSVLGVSATGLYLFKGAEAESSFNLVKVIIRVCAITPLVWIGWFSARQYGFCTRLKEEYAFKYAVSMAYEGYKKAASETNEELEDTLLELAMMNLAKSPTGVFSQNRGGVKGLPIEEMVENVLHKLPKFSKLTWSNDKLGKMTVGGFSDE